MPGWTLRTEVVVIHPAEFLPNVVLSVRRKPSITDYALALRQACPAARPESMTCALIEMNRSGYGWDFPVDLLPGEVATVRRC